MHGEGICVVLETRQAPPKKPGAEKAKTKGVPQMLFFASAILDWSLILGRGGGGGGWGTAVNWDFVLLLPPVTIFFFMYLYIFVTSKLN